MAAAPRATCGTDRRARRRPGRAATHADARVARRTPGRLFIDGGENLLCTLHAIPPPVEPSLAFPNTHRDHDEHILAHQAHLYMPCSFYTS
ncbi:hypothetical protein [Burkholderia pseudomallei]|uniref:hypothetical protein n=1 Tax=Burkholderia pseudomallei TaxID=28450 RepID=UPI000CCDE45F|nr:hypothetical protein [Burkholderia pseudomallei]PNX22401.1 hypothetical protein CF642_37915 [Burkholderia pseudomallei]